jgi:hypothetical protein
MGFAFTNGEEFSRKLPLQFFSFVCHSFSFVVNFSLYQDRIEQAWLTHLQSHHTRRKWMLKSAETPFPEPLCTNAGNL